MHKVDADAAWAILIERKGERAESRTAFIAALIASKCRNPVEPGHFLKGAVIAPNMCEAFAAALVRLAGLSKREAEAACSYERTESQIAAGERHEARFAAIAAALGFEARTGGDPRGACAYLIDPDERKGDGWGDGFAVYR